MRISKALGVCLASVTIAATACAGPSAHNTGMTSPAERSREPIALIEADEVFVARDVASLVRGSAIIAHGRVVASRDADFIQESADGSGVQFERITIVVTKALRNTTSTDLRAGSRICIRQMRSSAGSEPVINGLERAKVGQSGYFFVVPSSKLRDCWRTISTQGRYMIDASGRTRGGDHHDPVVGELTGLRPAELEDRINHG